MLNVISLKVQSFEFFFSRQTRKQMGKVELQVQQFTCHINFMLTSSSNFV